ncbi:hypothetical protein AB0K00_25105 [Dactylosporangium sp. NPDC049525]|uniref:hypothetical protein n=1 Tax=Dactylosporangium sp. NPDC049525 TaxID=3154730 RepID=UPI00341CA5F5
MSESFLPWRAYTVLLRVALAGSMYSAGVAVWLLRPGFHPVPTPVWLSAFLGCFLLQAAAMTFGRNYWRRRPMGAGDGSMRRQSFVTRVMFAGAVACIVVVLVLIARMPSAPALPPGAPEIAQGQYVLNNHGSLTAVPRDVYLRAVEEGQTLFASFAMGFFLVAAVVVWMTGDRLAAREKTFAIRPDTATDKPDRAQPSDTA